MTHDFETGYIPSPNGHGLFVVPLVPVQQSEGVLSSVSLQSLAAVLRVAGVLLRDE